MPALEKIEIPFNDFETMLSQNAKILFSGIFGSGKTTFLNDFFKNSEKYESIHIYPVNYSVASNKDIFEIIKHDVLLQLLGKVSKEDFSKLEIPYHLTLWSYLISNNDLGKKTDFIASFLNFAEMHGKVFLKVYEQIKSLKDGFLDFHEKFNPDDFVKVEEYLNSVTDEKGHVYEEDFYTELIRSLIKKIKETTNKEIVLVIDDLDRLDPEHIFRILNIFSAHIDFRGKPSDNKFDFDKIIIVCDYNNIASIFHHKYGKNSDFNGYIDKFYNAVYWYNSSSYINKMIDSYLRQVSTGVDYYYFENTRRIGGHIKECLVALIELNLLNFRQLIKYDKKFELNNILSKRKRDYDSESIFNHYIVNAEIIVLFFLNFFKNKHELNSVISKAKLLNKKRLVDSYDEFGLNKISELILLINHDKVDVKSFRGNLSKVELFFKNYFFECDVIRDLRNVTVTEPVIKEGSTLVGFSPVEPNVIGLNYFEVLEEAIKIYSDYINYNF